MDRFFLLIHLQIKVKIILNQFYQVQHSILFYLKILNVELLLVYHLCHNIYENQKFMIFIPQTLIFLLDKF